MRQALAPLVLLLLASCPSRPATIVVPRAPDLETAAVARGLVRDPRDRDPTGLYARDTDRLCIVPQGGGFRVGAVVDYGDGLSCNGAGRASRSGGALRIDLGPNCAFDARFDGDRIDFPARLPEGCAALCARTASFAALGVDRLSESISEAAAMRDAKGALPCAS